MKSLQVLKDVFGYTTFRPGQEKVIDLVLKGENVLAVMPTGAGKSMCYQIPALVNTGLTLVISPLISLMKDQIDSLKQNGINAAALNSATPQEEVNPILRQAYEGKIKLLYVTPERLAMDYFRYQLNFLDISLVAVDEAHCISQWGHDFRPAYRQIMDGVKSIKSNPNILALTATATPSVQDEYQKIQYQKLAMITKYVNTTECLQQFIVSYFGQRCDPCGKCSNCLGSFIEKDITSESKSIIATIYELDGRFGKTVVADVVSGANNQRMREIDAAHLRHYGSLKIGKSRVINLINYLISHNYLQLTDSQYPVVHVTNLGWDVLDNKKRVTQKISKKIEKLSQTYNQIPKEENDLFVRLKEVRLDLAKKQGIPAFYIFSDKSLREMALQKPKTKAEFLNISGVGQAKLKSYGQIMLAAIKNYLKEDAD